MYLHKGKSKDESMRDNVYKRTRGQRNCLSFFSLSDGVSFSMGIDASSYPKECWNDYYGTVESFVNSLTDSLKSQFWQSHKNSGGFVDWNKEIKSNLSANTDFDGRLINNFIDDFILEQLTYERPC